jgi:hypothetical protein
MQQTRDKKNWSWANNTSGWGGKPGFKLKLSRSFNAVSTHIKNETHLSIVQDRYFSQGLFVSPGMALMGIAALPALAPVAVPLAAVGALAAATGYAAGALVKHRLKKKQAKALLRQGLKQSHPH